MLQPEFSPAAAHEGAQRGEASEDPGQKYQGKDARGVLPGKPAQGGSRWPASAKQRALPQPSLQKDTCCEGWRCFIVEHVVLDPFSEDR